MLPYLGNYISTFPPEYVQKDRVSLGFLPEHIHVHVRTTSLCRYFDTNVEKKSPVVST